MLSVTARVNELEPLNVRVAPSAFSADEARPIDSVSANVVVPKSAQYGLE